MSTFKIVVQRRFEDFWPVSVTFSSPDGLPSHAEGRLQFIPGDREELIERQNDPEKYGMLLGERLFKGEVKDAFIKACDKNSDCLRVLLSFEVDEKDDLRFLYWERLCAPGKSENWSHLALDQKLPLSQYIATSDNRHIFSPFGRRNLRALILVASPQDLKTFQLQPFNVEATVDSVRSALGEIPCDVLANNIDGAIGAPSLDQLCEKLTNANPPYTLLHIVCHGSLKDGENILWWADNRNQVQRVSGEKLLKRLELLGTLPHLTFLSACESAVPKAEGGLGGLAQQLVRKLAMPAVIAMTHKISIKTALALGQSFYQHLRESGEVDLALVKAKAGLGNEDDIVVPALFSRLGERPLFSDLPDRQLTSQEIEYGLKRFQELIRKRAPILQDKFEEQKVILERIMETKEINSKLTVIQDQKGQAALAEMNKFSAEVLELSFNELALGKKVTKYDDCCPFPGLSPFKLEDNKFFFGRKELVTSFKNALKKDNFLAVIGSSGSGKSSIILAGLVPELQKEEPALELIYLTPGEEPLLQLEIHKLSALDRSIIFVVDQFEEVFTLCTDKEIQNDFIEKLLNLADQRGCDPYLIQ